MGRRKIKEMTLRRAFSPCDVLRIKTQSLPFEGPWAEAFGQPGRTGTWIVWGASGNGKSSFVMQLAKYLCRFGRVAYDSLEESTGYTLQRSLLRHKMHEVNGMMVVLDREPMEELSERMKRERSADFVIVDSFQYSGLNYHSYKALKERHPDKLIIFVSHADGQLPEGRSAKKVQFDADMKILVQGFRAFCKGRYIAKPGAYFTVWEEGAKVYWGGGGDDAVAAMRESEPAEDDNESEEEELEN